MISQFYKNSFVMFALISILSYGILAFNIENQGINIDEVFHHSFGMTYFDLVVEGKILDPCITGIGDCNLIDLTCANVTPDIYSGGVVKGVLLGIGDHFFSENDRIYYATNDAPNCRPIHNNVAVSGVNIPTQSELAAARFFSPILGSLTIAISFFIGKLLFSRFVGASFAAVLLFHGLWIHSSRIITSEVYVNFFIILSVFLLLYGNNKDKKTMMKFLIFGAITFALAVNTKMTSLELLPFLIIIIVFIQQPFNENINFRKLWNKRFFLKSIALVSIFIGIFFGALFSTFPFYYPDPISQLMVQYNVVQTYEALNEPWEDVKKVFLPFVASATIAPIIDGYYHIFSPDNIPNSTKSGHTFSSIPLTFFFIVGVGYLILKIKRKNLLYSEFLMLGWYVSIYVILSMVIDSYNTSRHFIPLIFPMILIMSYAVWRFLKPVQNKIRIPFFILIIFSHLATFLIFWEKIYFDPYIVWNLPVYFDMNQLCSLSYDCMRHAVNLKGSIVNPIVLCSGIVSLVIFLIIYMNKRKKSADYVEY